MFHVRNLGNVAVLPGILGSDLEDQSGRNLWIFPPNLAELALAPDGIQEATPSRSVRVAGATNLPYAPLLQVLRLSWDVLMFAYDWRKDLHETAELFAKTAKERFRGKSFHIVAHSMGGLVARLARSKFPSLQKGGRLVMLATPNHGSFLAKLLLTAPLTASAFFRPFGVMVSPEVAILSARTWPGAYQLLPCPFKEPTVASLYDDPPSVLSKRHIDAAARCHEELDHLPADSEMFYIAGSHVPTLDNGQFPTLEGDGVVSHRLGFLAGAKTFSVLSGHVELPANPLVLASITALLQTGQAPLLH